MALWAEIKHNNLSANKSFYICLFMRHIKDLVENQQDSCQTIQRLAGCGLRRYDPLPGNL